jgi:hypothetical protein
MYYYSAVLIMLPALLGISGCVSGPPKTEGMFNTSIESGGITVNTEKTGEGSLNIKIKNNTSETFDISVRTGKVQIGFDYRSNSPEGFDPFLYSDFYIDGTYEPLSPGEERVVGVLLDNVWAVNYKFDFTLRIILKNKNIKHSFSILVHDKDIFTDAAYLRKLNTTDYWHPRMAEENWRNYLRHIGADEKDNSRFR